MPPQKTLAVTVVVVAFGERYQATVYVPPRGNVAPDDEEHGMMIVRVVRGTERDAVDTAIRHAAADIADELATAQT